LGEWFKKKPQRERKNKERAQMGVPKKAHDLGPKPEGNPGINLIFWTWGQNLGEKSLGRVRA